MPFRPYSRGLSRQRRELVKGSAKKMGLPWNAYYVLTKAEASLTNSKIHPNTGSPDYDIEHLHSELEDMPSATNADHDSRYLNLDAESTNITNGEFNLTTTGTITCGGVSSTGDVNSAGEGIYYLGSFCYPWKGVASAKYFFTDNEDSDKIHSPSGNITILNTWGIPEIKWGSFPDYTLTATNLKTAYDHSQDNSQAHSDYLLNNADDATTGTLTAANLKATTSGLIWADGTTGSTPASGAGVRFMWIPDKYALRAGRVTGDTWDAASIGNYSAAFGYNTTASTTACAAFGNSTTASGVYSTAYGYSTTASGGQSIAYGSQTTASGGMAISAGYNTLAEAYACLAIGRWNIGGGTGNQWITTDPIFEIGIGADTDNRANALTVFKNGNATLSGGATIGGTGTSTFNEDVTFLDDLTITDKNIVLSTTTGTKIGTATTQKLAFYNATPVDQPLTVSDAATQDLTGGDTVDKTKTETDLTSCKNTINAVIDRLQELGLIA